MKRLVVSMLMLVCITTSNVNAQMARGGRDGGQRGSADPERPKAAEWAKVHMPNLYTLASTPPFRQRYMQTVLNHYRIFSSANPMGQSKLGAVYALEDNIYGLIIKLENAPPDEKPAIKESVVNALKAMVQGNLDDRARRIEKLKKDLADEEQKLADDRKKVDEILKRRLANQYGIEFTPTGPTSAPSTRPSGDSSNPTATDTLAAPAQ